jgi:phosphoglycerate dehydrogenase-like enzyme
MNSLLTIWCNAMYADDVMAELQTSVKPHRLVLAQVRNKANLIAGTNDPLLDEAGVAFGQPDIKQVVQLPRLKWIHLTTAGYTRYDTPEIRSALRARNGMLTTSSGVYDEPCALHVLSYMLAHARRLPQCWKDQATTRAWHAAEHRAQCSLLEGETALILGFGTIARRLIELLAPLRMNVMAVRRSVTGTELIPTYPQSRLKELVPQADHVINVLPSNASTDGLFNAEMLAAMKPTAMFYNIGRGTTVDQPALTQALQSQRIGGAYLDVTDPEPLPVDHPLWGLPNCWITPHTAGGHVQEFFRIVRHFVENLRRYEKGNELLDRII